MANPVPVIPNPKAVVPECISLRQHMLLDSPSLGGLSVESPRVIDATLTDAEVMAAFYQHCGLLEAQLTSYLQLRAQAQAGAVGKAFAAAHPLHKYAIPVPHKP